MTLLAGCVFSWFIICFELAELAVQSFMFILMKNETHWEQKAADRRWTGMKCWCCPPVVITCHLTVMQSDAKFALCGAVVLSSAAILKGELVILKHKGEFGHSL